MEYELMLKAYKIMLESRILDEFCEGEFVNKGVNLRHYHSGIGQEALSVSGAINLRRDDYLYYTHRGVAPLLAKGLPLDAVMRDLFFKPGGTNRGTGSVMHTCAPEYGIPGRNGVFGERFSISSGLALSAKLRNTQQVTVCYYGEAAAARGMYYEAINLAVLWKLPVIFIGENNGFSISSRTRDIYANGDLSSMWRGYDIPVVKFDGNDIAACLEAVEAAVERARRGEGPSVLEGVTYRISAHIPMEAEFEYRSPDEVKDWRKKDPIDRAKLYLLSGGAWSEEQDRQLRDKIYKEVRDNYAQLEKTPIVDQSEMYTMVYYGK